MDEAQSEEAGGFSFSPKESSALGSSGPPAARLETDGEAPDVGRLLEALSVGRTLWDHGAQADGPPHAHPAPLHTGLWLGESAPRARAARERDTGCWEPADRSLNLVTQLIFFTHLLEKLNVFVTKHLRLFPLNQVFETFLDL